jgi:putative membrane protein insertion efficiency factor
MMRRFLAMLGAALTAFLIAGVRFYQIVLRPLLPSVCRFYPSCSEYFILAVRKYGPLYGACKGMGRICRCNPWSAGGYDPP